MRLFLFFLKPALNGAVDESGNVGVAPHEVSERGVGVYCVAHAQDFIGKLAPRFGVQHALALEARKGVGVENLRPLVGVVSGGVSDGVSEKVGEARKN